MNEKRVEVGLLDRGVREKKLKDLREKRSTKLANKERLIACAFYEVLRDQ